LIIPNPDSLPPHTIKPIKPLAVSNPESSHNKNPLKIQPLKP